MRSVIQTLLGVWLFGDILTVNRATSIMVILGGTMYYTWAKHVESNMRPSQHAAEVSLAKSSEGEKISMGLVDRERDLEAGSSIAEDPEVMFEVPDEEELRRDQDSK